MKTTKSAPANLRVDPEFKGWTPPASWWEQPGMRSSIMTFYLCRPGGIAWGEAASTAQAYNDAHGLKTFTVGQWRSQWRGHAKWWSERHPEFSFDDDGERGTLVRNSDRPLGQKELIELIERTRPNRTGRPGTSPNRADRPGTAPIQHGPKDYDIGDGNSSVYAYYYPKYRENGEADFPIKIGRSIDYPDRIKAQTTGMPEKPEVSIVWRTDRPEAAERLLHELLKFRGKHKLDAPGREWFRTSPDEIRQIIECIQPGVSIRNTLTAEEI